MKLLNFVDLPTAVEQAHLSHWTPVEVGSIMTDESSCVISCCLEFPLHEARAETYATSPGTQLSSATLNANLCSNVPHSILFHIM